MTALIASLSGVFRSRAALQLEILALRHQIGVLQRSVKRPKLTTADRLLWAWLCSVWQDWRSGVHIIKASTVVGWHRKGFRLFWTWKIRRGKPGRPGVPKEVRELIRTMSRENPLWGAPKIHGELLKLGIEIGETSVSKYMVRRRRPPSQTWKTFLENHVKSMVSVDFFAVPTIRFQILYVFLVLAHERRRIVHFAVTAHPTAEWTAQQMREAFPWDDAPRYLLRDRDRIFGKDFVDQVKAMGIKQVLSAPRSPWQRALCRTADRHHSPRVPGPHDRIQRALFIPTPQKLRGILPSQPHPFGAGEGQPGAPTDPAARRWTDHRHSGGWWAASSVRAARCLNRPPAIRILVPL